MTVDPLAVVVFFGIFFALFVPMWILITKARNKNGVHKEYDDDDKP